jgi:hypothetical protein
MAEQKKREDPTRDLLAKHAQACLEELLRQNGRSRRGSVSRSAKGLSVRVTVSPTPAPRRPKEAAADGLRLTECERDCWELIGELSRQQQRAGADYIRETLEARGSVYARVSVKRALARLHKHLNLLCYSRRRPSGYWRPDITPLFQPGGNPPFSAAS